MKAIGFPQNPSDIAKLYDIASLFVQNSNANSRTIANIEWLCNQQLEYEGTYYDAADTNLFLYKNYLTSGAVSIPYDILRGTGSGNTPRPAAPCSGIIQAVLHGQKTYNYKDKNTQAISSTIKPYTDDWTADGFLRWAISIGILDYDETSDFCSLSRLGRQIAACSGFSDPKFKVLLGEAFLSYPPVCRILELLDATYGITPGSVIDPLLTKFKLGSELGFIGEPGFTSIAENIWLAEYDMAQTSVDKTKVRNNREGTMDKHARMVCRWLEQLGWVSTHRQNVSGSFCGTTYSANMPCYYITIPGHNAFKNSFGNSSHHRIPKNVYLGTLATKSNDADYLSSKRAYIVDCISGAKRAKNICQIQAYLANKGFSESESTIRDDILGLKRIGILVSEPNPGYFHVDDIINHLCLPTATSVTPSTVIAIINNLRATISHINHKYLNLIGYSVESSKNRDLEQLTLELLTNELGFDGKWLGGSSRPDGIISENTNGLIIDTKAYSKGYNLPRAQKDEMFRYISDFVFKNSAVNATKWWLDFSPAVSEINFSFVSSNFTSTVSNGLNDISKRTVSINGGTAINGGAISTKVLLEKAEAVKNGTLSKIDFIMLFNNNSIVV